MPTPVPIYISNDAGFNPANAAAIQPISSPVLSCPFTSVNIEYQLTQKFQCFRNKFQPLPLNTKWGTWFGNQADAEPYKDFILCSESPREQMGGDVVEWTRTYGKVPATYKLPGEFSYHFIGFQGAGGTNVVAVKSRPRFSQTVAATIQYDYYLLDPDNGPLKTPFDIPVISETLYFLNATSVPLYIFTDELTSTAVSDQPTVPSLDDYRSWITDNAAQASPTHFLVAKPSTVKTWIGNIVERQTVYILPK